MAVPQRTSGAVCTYRKPIGRLVFCRGYRAHGRRHAALRQGQREEVELVEDASERRAGILRRYLELAPGARPFFPIDRRAPLEDFERLVDQYPVFRVV
jgi:hypothetical protein